MIRGLVVDDERLVLSALRRTLMRADMEVFTASSGAEGLAVLDQETVDLVVSDYKMPGMNGIEFLKQVSAGWPAVRRCMLTAQADPETTDDALATGVLHKALRKPWDNFELIESLKALAAGPE